MIIDTLLQFTVRSARLSLRIFLKPPKRRGAARDHKRVSQVPWESGKKHEKFLFFFLSSRSISFSPRPARASSETLSYRLLYAPLELWHLCDVVSRHPVFAPFGASCRVNI